MGGGAEHNFVTHYLGAGLLFLFFSFLFFIFEKGLSLIDLNFDKKDRLVSKQVLKTSLSPSPQWWDCITIPSFFYRDSGDGIYPFILLMQALCQLSSFIL